MSDDSPTFSGTYSDLKLIKTRGVCSISIEIPLSHAQAFIAKFGMPDVGTEKWIALALMDYTATKEEPKARTYSATRDCAIHCQDSLFGSWLERKLKRKRITRDLPSSEETTAMVRDILHINSRAELDRDSEAGKRWKALRDEYEHFRTRVTI
jgi:hypothetical protein